MRLKDELAQHRLAIMRLRVRGANTKPQSYLQNEITTLRRTLDKAEAHIKFLEDELRARGEV